jgi:hypothetical protein
MRNERQATPYYFRASFVVFVRFVVEIGIPGGVLTAIDFRDIVKLYGRSAWHRSRNLLTRSSGSKKSVKH